MFHRRVDVRVFSALVCQLLLELVQDLFVEACRLKLTQVVLLVVHAALGPCAPDLVVGVQYLPGEPYPDAVIGPISPSHRPVKRYYIITFEIIVRNSRHLRFLLHWTFGKFPVRLVLSHAGLYDVLGLVDALRLVEGRWARVLLLEIYWVGCVLVAMVLPMQRAFWVEFDRAIVT